MIAATLLLAACFFPPPPSSECERDVSFALEELEKKCGHFFQVKDIDWKAVSREMVDAAKKAKTDSDHYGVLIRLAARLRDGHAYAAPADANAGPEPPAEFVASTCAPGLHLCRDARTKKVHVKAAWGAAERAGLTPGVEIVAVDGKPVDDWLQRRIEHWRDLRSLGTDAHARGFALSRGLAVPRGTKLKFAIKPPKGGAKTITLTVNDDEDRRVRPPFEPKDGKEISGLTIGKTPAGHGYLFIPKVESDLPARVDAALAALGELDGLVLDFRGNSGGGCDHDQLLGLFVKKGGTLNRSGASPLPSYGENPYSGKIVVIVDGMVVSAGETASGMFKEDGRAYLIGEDTTAGMSGSKEDLALPSGKFVLRFVVRSHKARFNGGRGLEGVGVIPHEIVAYEPADLAKGIDTLVARADALLKKFPADQVPYRAD